MAAARALAALLLLLAAASARADGLSAAAEVTYSNGQTTTTDSTGRSITVTSNLLPQRYRLSLDKQLFPYVVLNGSFFYNWTPGWSVVDGVESNVNGNNWSLFASAVLGPPVVNVTPYYQRREEWATSTTAGVSFRSPTLVNQTYGAYAGWTPADFPLLNLRWSRTENFDSAKQFQNTATNELVLNLTYTEIRDLQLRYVLRWGQANDYLQDTRTDDLNQGAQVMWSGSYLERRLNTSVIYNVGYRTTQVTATGSGTVTVQKFPVAGLSLVETFPSTPAQSTLLPNPALIDGDVTTGAGLDIGFGPSLAGDRNFRDMGVQFPDATGTEVNTVYVWVNRQLPPDVARTYAFTAWTSNDNVTWTQIPVTGPVVFALFYNRFEIPVARGAARYLKVVTQPLVAGVTVDPQFSSVQVTEMQVFLVVPASQAPPRDTQWGGNFNGSVRALLWQPWNLAYTLALNGSHVNSFAIRDWSVLNSLTAAKQVTRTIGVGAQLSRTDSAQTNLPHEAMNRWSAQVSYDPFATMGVSLNYAGQYGQQFLGDILTHSLTLTGHLDPWQGVSLAATAGYTWARDPTGRRLESPNATIGLTLVPFPSLTVNGTWGVSSSIVTGGSTGVVAGDQTTSLQGSVAFTPVRALYFNAGVIRSTGGGQGPQTLVNFGTGLSPFAGGQLLIRFSYNENLDTIALTRNRVFGPAVRWNIRMGWYLDVAYTWSDTAQPSQLTRSQGLFANLFLSFQ